MLEREIVRVFRRIREMVFESKSASGITSVAMIILGNTAAIHYFASI